MVSGTSTLLTRQLTTYNHQLGMRGITFQRDPQLEYEVILSTEGRWDSPAALRRDIRAMRELLSCDSSKALLAWLRYCATLILAPPRTQDDKLLTSSYSPRSITTNNVSSALASIGSLNAELIALRESAYLMFPFIMISGACSAFARQAKPRAVTTLASAELGGEARYSRGKQS